MEKFISLLEIIGVSMLLSVMIFAVLVILVVLIDIISTLTTPFKVNKNVHSPFFGEGKIVITNRDNVIVRFNNHTQAYDSKGKAVLEVKVRSGLKSTLRDNIKVIK